MNSFFTTIYTFAQKRKFLFAGIVFSLVLFLGYFASRISFQENITQLIPTNNQTGVTSKVLEQVNFADKITLVIHSSQNQSPDSLTRYANLFLEELDTKCKPFVKKIQGKMEDENLQETYDFVYANLPLFLDKKDYSIIQNKLKLDSIATTISAAYKSIISPSGIISKNYILKDPLGISFLGLKKLQQLSIGDDYELHNGYVLTKDKKNLLLFITPKLAANETDKNTQFVQEIEKIKNKLNKQFNNKTVLSYYGATPVAVANATQIKADVRNTSIFATLSLILILAFFYRNIATPILIFIPSICGALLALSVLYFTKGTISAISLGISSILLGETTDYSIYVLTHLRNKRDIKLLYKDISKPLLVCGITTAITFLCLFFIQSEALQDLAIFAALSVIATTIFSLVFIPLLYKPKKTEKAEKSNAKSNIIDNLGTYPYHKNKFFIIIVLVLLGISAFTYHKVTFNDNLSSLNFMTPELKKTEKYLEKIANGSAKSIYLVSYGKNYEEAINQNNLLFNNLEQYKANNKITHFSSIGGILLSKELQSQKIKEWNAFWNTQKVKQVTTNLITNGNKFGFKENSFLPFYETLNKRFKPISVSEYAKVKALFIDEFVASKNGLYTISNLVKVRPNLRDTFIKEIKKQKNIVVIDRQETNQVFLSALKSNFEKLVNYSFILIFIVLFLTFKRIELVIVSIIPIAVSWLITTGTMGLFSIQFNVINIIVCTLIFGIGVDYSIFMTMALQKEHTFGKIELPTYKTSILLSVATTILGIGVLIIAKHPALQSIALIGIIGIFSALLITFVVQPLVFYFFVGFQVQKGNPPFELKRLLHSTLSFLYYGLGGLILSIIGTIMVKIIPISKAKKMQAFHYIMSKFMYSVFLTYPSVKRKILNSRNENFEKPAVIIANHTSFLDILAVGMLSPKIIFLVSDWVYNSPFFGKGVRLAGFYPVSSGIDNGIEHLQEKVNQGYSLMVFPEGTRSVDNTVKRFHKGAFFLAEQFNLDIIPIIIHGYSEGSPKGDFMLYKAKTTVKILDRIAIKDTSFGLNYKDRTKKINIYFKEKYQQIRNEQEDALYFKSTLLNSFDYKETDIIQSVKNNFIKNNHLFFRINSFVGAKDTILHFANDYGELDILLSLQQSQRKIDSYIEDENYRNVAKTNCYLKKRTITYLDKKPIVFEKYQVILISNNIFLEEISTFTGTLILLKQIQNISNFAAIGFTIQLKTNEMAVLKKL